MRLEAAHLGNFRSCYDTTIQFAEHLTLLVGENDGKSNVVDALRAAIYPASGRVTLWFDTERDLSYGIADGSAIHIERIRRSNSS
jgi:putative ATP-dependent endonuclease of OLD family